MKVGGIIERTNERHTEKLRDMLEIQGQSRSRMVQNELTAGLMPGHGFMCAGAVKVILF